MTTSAPKTAVLVAEDNKTAQTMIRAVIARLGCAVEIVNDGVEALAALERSPAPYGVLLTDCHMPNMDGFALARAIRRREAQTGAARLPIIALTADALPQTDGECRDAGMDGVLAKPIKREALAEILQKWGQPSPANTPAQAATPPAATAPPSGPIDHAIIEAQLQTADRAAHIEALQSFLEFCGDGPADLQAALDARDAAQTRQIAHSLKGAAAMIGATALSRTLGVMEDAGRTADLATAAAAMASARQGFEDVGRYLDELRRR